MEVKVKTGLILLLLNIYVRDGFADGPKKICATLESDVELPFQTDLTCGKKDNWRLERDSTDVYFCREGFLDYAHDFGRKNIIFSKTRGSITLQKVQQSDAGLYKICDDSHSYTHVELVVRADEEGCKEALGEDFSKRQNDGDHPASSDSTIPSNNSSINTSGIIGGVFGAVVLLLLLLSVCIYCCMTQNRNSTPAPAPAPAEEVELKPIKIKKVQGQDQDTTDPLMGAKKLPRDQKCHL